MTGADAPDVHWGAQPVDPTERTLPGLKARFLLRHAPERGSVMEIGCGEGKMLRTLARHRPGLDLHGCDVRPPTTGPDCYVFHPMTNAVPAKDGTFDAVLVFDVLEHVPEPADLLAEAARILRPGGRLIAFVPVEGERFSFYSLFRRLLGQDTYILTKEHIQSFRHKQLQALLERAFVVAEHRYAYHFLGHFMDASFFAVTRIEALRRFWWNDNSFYNEPVDAGWLSRTLNGLLKAGNLVAFYESRLLEKVRLGAAGVLLVASPLSRHQHKPAQQLPVPAQG